MVKQIRNGELVEKLIQDGKSYFRWLQKKSDLDGPLSSLLADTDFENVNGIDDVLVEKTKEELRLAYAEDVLEDYEGDHYEKAVETVVKSVRGPVCLFEVMLCLAISINEMFEDLDAADGPAHFFGILMKNCGLDLYDEEDYDTRPETVDTYWKKRIEMIRKLIFPGCDVQESLWKQMNFWIDRHTNEDGEWVD